MKKKLPNGAPIGNQNALALKTPELRKEAYQKYCEWLAAGNSPKTFYFVKDSFKCSGQTMDEYLKKFADEFPLIDRQIAFAKGMAFWEEEVKKSATGKSPKSNPASLQMIMRNKYGWDKKDRSDESFDEMPVRAIFDMFKAIEEARHSSM